MPAAVALALPWLGWRGAVEVYGIVGLVAAAVILVLLARLGAGLRPAPSPTGATPERGSGSGIRDVRAFTAISAIHVIDNSTRTGFLTFLPFLLIGKGATVQSVGLALMLVFMGGAVGKFACGALADRVGVIRTVVVTELVTGAGILFLLTLPLGACLVALPVLGRGAQRHVVRALRQRGRSRVERAAGAELRDLLHARHRRLRAVALRVRAAQRLGRRPAHPLRRRAASSSSRCRSRCLSARRPSPSRLPTPRSVWRLGPARDGGRGGRQVGL